tara:strand:+ start:87 stop:473 length:387 start_codon:yes stop_codon:yes gene_type:complete
MDNTLDFGNVVSLNDYRETTWNDVKDSSYPFFEIVFGNDVLLGKYWFDDDSFQNKGQGIETGTIFGSENLIAIHEREHYGKFFYLTDETFTKEGNFVWCFEVHISAMELNDSAKNKFLFTSNAELPLY